MRKNIFGSFSLTSLMVATTLVGVDAQIALACSSGGSNLGHGSSMDSESVTVCVSSSNQSPGSTHTQKISKTIKVPSKPKPSIKPAPTKVKLGCPTAAQISSIPRSADAAERWVKSICTPPIKAVTVAKPSLKIKPKTKKKSQTITREIPGHAASISEAVKFFPKPLKAVMWPANALAVGQLSKFSSNPTAHFGTSVTLGKQTQVHFVPAQSGWSFSDGVSKSSADITRAFASSGKFQARAWVKYKVSYRLVGHSKWHPVEGLLTVRSNTLNFLVVPTLIQAEQRSLRPLLVGADCSYLFARFGCDI